MAERKSHKKVVIMTVPFGGGHYAMARTLAELLRARDASLDVEIIDVITEAWPAFSRRTTDTYVKSTASPGGFWFKIYYHLTDRFPQPLRWFASIAFKSYARRRILELKPDLIIATFPFLGHVASEARDYHGLNMPIVTTITDAGRVQGIWLCGYEDVILTATEDTLDYASQRQLGLADVKYMGFPVDEDFRKPIIQAKARQDLRLEDLFTVLVTVGGLGMSAGRVKELAQHLTQIEKPIQLVFTAGKNEQLLNELKKYDFPVHVRTRFYGFTDKMSQLMAASDMVCSKAGWLTLSEALALKKPLLIFDAIPGHEEQNAEHIVSGNYGMFIDDAGRAAEFIERVASGERKLDTYRAALERRAQATKSTGELADYLLSLL